MTRAELDEKMERFYNSHEDAAAVLAAYSDVDPFHCYYGEDINPDEYMGYAERFLKCDLPISTLDRVRSSFHESQWQEGWITDYQCEQIAAMIGMNWQKEV